MRKLHPLLTALLFTLATASAQPAFAAAEEDALKQANTLISQGDFKTAYQLLEPLEASRAGEINFDYLFGIAAVETGNATRGAFALERVLAQDSNHQSARAEMAKAHLILGENEASKAEFGNVLQQNPDADTKKSIQKFLATIDKLEGTTTSFGAYLEFGLGWDSNVSSAPNLNAIGVPVFGGLVLDLGDSGKEKSDNLISFAGGLSVRQPLSERWAMFGAVSGNNKINGSETEFDTSTLDFNLGVDYRLERHTFTLAAQDNHFDLGGEKFRNAYGASAQWLYSINANNQIGAYAQYTGLSYHNNRVRNADRQIVGINAAHVFEGDLKPVLFASVYAGNEDARKNSFHFLDQNIWGVRAGGQLTINPKWQAFANVGYESRDNDAQDPAFFKKRNDDQYDTTIGLRFMPARDWVIKPQVNYTKNDSNLKINAFDRTIFTITVRKDFSW